MSLLYRKRNVEKYIRTCVESILCQCYSDFELIIVDDGSTDHSLEICKNLEKQDFRIKIYEQRNSGVAAARNKGIDIAKGECIAFVDSDDVVDPFWLYEMYSVYCKNKTGIPICRYDAFVGNKPKFNDNRRIVNAQEIHKKGFWNLHMQKLTVAVWNKLYRRDVIIDNNIRFDETFHYGEDGAFCLEYFKFVTGPFYVIEKTLYWYRKDNNMAMTRQKYIPNLRKSQKKGFLLIKENIGDEFKGMCEEEYYREYLKGIVFWINNTLQSPNIICFGKCFLEGILVFHFNKDIVRAINYMTVDSYSATYRNILKSRIWMLILIYSFVGKIKRSLRK